MNKLFKKVITFTLASCMCITGIASSLFACSSTDGIDGKDGVDGIDGVDGVDGADGVGISNAVVNADGNLIITLTDGTVINCGSVNVGNTDSDDSGDSDDSSDNTDAPSTETPAPDIYKRDEEGNLFTGFDENAKFYIDGLLYSGMRVFDTVLSKVENGVVTPFTGVYENIRYSNGQAFSGIYDDTKLYSAGSLFTGVYTDNKYYEFGVTFNGVHSDGKVYVDGLLYTGTKDGREYTDGSLFTGVKEDKLYMNGVLYTGNHTDSKEYLNGTLFSGTKNGKEYLDGSLFTGEKENKYYVLGEVFSGNADGKEYSLGGLFTGTKNGMEYVDGSLFSGVKDGKLYSNGIVFSGVHTDTKIYENGKLVSDLKDGKVYINGVTFNGVYSDGKYYENGVVFSGKHSDGKLYRDGQLFTGKNDEDGKYYQDGLETVLKLDENGNMFTGFDGDIYYKDGLLFTGVYEGKYYAQGSLLVSGITFVEGVLFSVENGVMTEYIGNYNEIYYENGIVYSGIKVLDGKLYVITNGIKELYNGEYENKIYVDGELYNGAKVIDGVLYEVTDGAKTEFNGKYDETLYSQGVAFNGVFTDNLYYENGKLFTGLHTDGKLYESGALVSGKVNEIEYLNGVLFTGIKDEKLYSNGVIFSGLHSDEKLYADGVLFTGEKDGTLYKDGIITSIKYDASGELVNGIEGDKFYKDGELYTGVNNNTYYESGLPLSSGYTVYENKLYYVSNGEMTICNGEHQNLYYSNGVVANTVETIDGKLYVITNGVKGLYNGTYAEKEYANGELYSGTKIIDGALYNVTNGVISIVDGVHTDGKVYVGGYVLTGIYSADNCYYENGMLFTGIHASGKYYKDGKLLTGNDGTNLYVDGVKFTGKYTGDNLYYENGVLFSGMDGLGKVYRNGELLSGIYENKTFLNGSLLTGTGTDSLLYVDGVKFTGTYHVDGKYYSNGELFTGTYNDTYYVNGIVSNRDSVETLEDNQIKVFILAGQSNAVGVADTDDLNSAYSRTYEDVMFYVNGDTTQNNISDFNKWMTVKNGYGIHTGCSGSELGMASVLSQLYPKQNGKHKVAIIKYAWGGTGLAEQWLSETGYGIYHSEGGNANYVSYNGNMVGHLYKNMMDTINSGLQGLRDQGYEPEVSGMAWMQGCNDAYSMTWANNYDGMLACLIDDVRGHVDNPNMPVAIGEIGIIFSQYSDIIRDKQRKLGTTYPYCSFVSSQDLEIKVDDWWHFTSDSLYALGRRYVSAIVSNYRDFVVTNTANYTTTTSVRTHFQLPQYVEAVTSSGYQIPFEVNWDKYNYATANGTMTVNGTFKTCEGDAKATVTVGNEIVVDGRIEQYGDKAWDARTKVSLVDQNGTNKGSYVKAITTEQGLYIGGMLYDIDMNIWESDTAWYRYLDSDQVCIYINTSTSTSGAIDDSTIGMYLTCTNTLSIFEVHDGAWDGTDHYRTKSVADGYYGKVKHAVKQFGTPAFGDRYLYESDYVADGSNIIDKDIGYMFEIFVPYSSLGIIYADRANIKINIAHMDKLSWLEKTTYKINGGAYWDGHEGDTLDIYKSLSAFGG